MFNRSAWRATRLAMLSLCIAVLAAPIAHAAEVAAPVDDTEGWKKICTYVACAWTVFRVVTPGDAVVAMVTCGKVLAEEPPLPNGGF